MLFDYNHNNLYKWYLAINFFREFHVIGLTLTSKPCSAIHSYPTYKEEIFGKIKMFPPCHQEQRKCFKKSHMIQQQNFSLQQNKGCPFVK